MNGPPAGPALTTDCVVFDADRGFLLIRRGYPPFQGAYALPGGFVETGESVEDACRRELEEETGLAANALRLVGVYSEPGRDPRGPTVSIAYLAVVSGQSAAAGSDAAATEWIKDWRDLELAFDHARILGDAEKVLARPDRSPA
ncbi:MAG: NUDIX domain-containing protein [Methyloligellaceae bacterium]